MKPLTLRNPLVILLATGIFPSAIPALAGTASPTPTVAVSKTGAQVARPVPARPLAEKNGPLSPVLRKPAAQKMNIPALDPPWLYANPEYSKPLLDYDKLNADLYPILSIRPHRPTADEKFWGTVAGVAGYSIAGVAAAQGLGILPNDWNKEKK